MGSIDTSKYSKASNNEDARIDVAEVSDKDILPLSSPAVAEIKDKLNHEDVGNASDEEPVRLLESLTMIFLACYTIYWPHVSYLFLFHLSLVMLNRKDGQTGD